MVVHRVVGRMATKAGLRKGFYTWHHVTTDIIARNRREHRVTAKMLRYRFALIFRVWHVLTADLGRQHRICLRALSAICRRRMVDCFGRWTTVVYHAIEESRQHFR